MPAPRALLANVLFILVGPGLEAGLAPFLLTRGWQQGEGVLGGDVVAVTGVVAITAGLAGLVACFIGFLGAGNGTPSPLAPARDLMATGIYRYSRNPMYLTTAALIAGQGLLLAQPILLAGAAVYLAAMAILVVRVEEPLLARRFGVAWDAYATRVPRWL